MGISLVSAGATSTSLNPSFGQATGSGHLLVAYLACNSSSSTDPFSVATGSGWTKVASAGTAFDWVSMFYKANCGASETAPTFNPSGMGSPFSKLIEFSGAALTNVLDQSGVTSSAASNPTATCGAVDAASGDLIAGSAYWNGSNAGPTTITSVIKDSNGTSLSVTADNNASTTGTVFYDFSWAIAGSTLGASADTLTDTLGVFANGFAVIASFKAAAAAASGAPPESISSRRYFVLAASRVPRLRQNPDVVPRLPISWPDSGVLIRTAPRSPIPLVQTPRKRQNADLVPAVVTTPPATFPGSPSRYPQRTPLSPSQVSRKRQEPDLVPGMPPSWLDAISPQRIHVKPPFPHRAITISGLPVTVQPPEASSWMRPITPRKRFLRSGVTAATGWPVPVQPLELANSVRARWKPPWPRRGVTETGLPVPVQPPETSQWLRPRFTRVLLFRKGTVPSSGLPVPVQPPELPIAVRPIDPRKRFLRSGVVAATGWPVPVQPTYAWAYRRRWTRPLLPRRVIIRSVSPPPVIVNPPISWSYRRWSRPLWYRRGVIVPTGWPVPVQPQEVAQSVRPHTRSTRIRRGSTELGISQLITIVPFSEAEAKRFRSPVVRAHYPIQIPSIIPGPVPSVTRKGHDRKIIRESRVAAGSPVQPPVQAPFSLPAVRRYQRYQWFRRGTTQPNSGLTVPVQPSFIRNYLRRWVRPLFPRRGIVPPSAPLPVIVVEVKLPIWAWITQELPLVQVTQSLPFVWITIIIPLGSEEEV